MIRERRRIDEEHTEAEDEEGMKPIIAKDEQGPSEQEINEHMVTQIPFRPWCPFCVMGKARSSDRRRIKEPQGIVPVISIDDGYMGE